MNRTKWSAFTVLSVCLLIVVSSTSAVPDVQANAGNLPVVTSARAQIVGNDVVITGTVTGHLQSITITDEITQGTTVPDGNGNFTITYPDTGETFAMVGAWGINGQSEPVNVVIEE